MSINHPPVFLKQELRPFGGPSRTCTKCGATWHQMARRDLAPGDHLSVSYANGCCGNGEHLHIHCPVCQFQHLEEVAEA